MAFECREGGDSLSKNSVILVRDELPQTTSSKCPTSCRTLNPNPSSKLDKKKLASSSKSASKAPPPVEDPTSNGFRSITDLPQALVSEILSHLNAKELGIVSCVSTFLYNLASDHRKWKDFYFLRWGPPLELPLISPDQKRWKELFLEREFRSNSYMGRFSTDILRGHTEAVRSIFLLLEAKLIFTGGYDSVIRMWDMEDGLSISCSRSLGCTIRAVCADTELLVTGGTGSFLHCWTPTLDHPHLFDIAGCSPNTGNEFRLWGHEGPVTCISMDSLRIFSGSWDMSVRIWDRGSRRCARVLRHGDWVWSLAPRGSTIAATAGADAYVWNIEDGSQLAVISGVQGGNTFAIARTNSENLIFTGGEDGAVRLFELDGDGGMMTVGTWVPHTAAVQALAFEYPWLVSCAGDGRLAVIDVRKVTEPPRRILHCGGRNLFAVAIGSDRICCSGEEGVVRVWNFSEAVEMEKRVRALRGMRLEKRMRRRRVQVELSGRSGSSGQCLLAAKRNPLGGDRGWQRKRGVAGKLKA